ncbi:unnamed protein product [Bursaphelenchus okinawaensis]|uniref:VWFA domain-containing protein n=1 Tax=Bursaphelenchus okinawaensis TaxID=465554 RepID=A0A811JTK9_9BILA|nr:unnamed protein product [Bursaphelenchus okinawaensis]CAG9081986.1 unnamed protein product [Bursaphelenchus okinawaensis]
MRIREYCNLLWLISVFGLVVSQKCERTPIKVLVVFDITLGDGFVFNSKKTVTEEVLRHVDAVGKGRDINYGFIAYHSHAVVLSSLKSNKSGSVDNIISHLNNIRPRPGFKSSIANSLNTAVDHINQQTNIEGHNLIILVNNGGETENTDNFALATKRLWALNTDVFVISDPSYLSLSMLLTRNKKHVLTELSDFPLLLKEIDSSIGTCLEDVQPNGIPRLPLVDLKSSKSRNLGEAIQNLDCSEDHSVTFLNILGNKKDLIPTNFTDFLGSKNVNVVTISSTSESVAHLIQEEVDHLSQSKKQATLIIFNQKAARSSWDQILDTYSSLEKNRVSVIVGNAYKLVENEIKIYAGPKGLAIPKLDSFVNVITEFVQNCKVINKSPPKSLKLNKVDKASTTTNTKTTKTSTTTSATTTPILTTTTTSSTKSLPIVESLSIKQEDTPTTTSLPQGAHGETTTITSERTTGETVGKCDHELDVHVVLASNANEADFERQRSLLLEIAISMPRRFKLATLQSNGTFTNEKDNLLSAISTLSYSDVQKSNSTEFLNSLPARSSVIYIDLNGNEIVNRDYNRFDYFVVITSKDNVPIHSQKYSTFDESLVGGPRFYSNAFKCRVEDTVAKNTTEIKRLAKSADPVNQTTVVTSDVPKPISLVIDGEDCRSDIIFVVDTSQSVENKFQEQLRLIASFLESIPEADFTNRIKTGVVTFNNEAKKVLDLSAFNRKRQIIDTVLNIEHTGGPTSLVKGIRQTITLIKNTNNISRQLVVVLVSDGNSQDEWNNVLETSNALHSLNSNIFAVTVSNDYFLRELEIYAGEKDRVYVEGRLPQFLTTLKKAVIQCDVQDVVVPQEITKPTCDNDVIDLMLIVDLSLPTFSEIKQLLIKFIKTIDGIGSRIQVALSKAGSQASLVFGFREGISSSDVIFEIEKLSESQVSSLVGATNVAVNELLRSKRGAHKIVLLISYENDRDQLNEQMTAGMRLKDISDIVYVYSPKGNQQSLKSYINNDASFFADAQEFVTAAQEELQCKKRVNKKFEIDSVPELEAKDVALPLTEAPLIEHVDCIKNKMDIIIILDASTSRENVFEHQRELALSLIERLPISKGDTHVATGINSFNEEATLRQSLSVGRDRDMVRESIEQINYLGGSTYTSKAVNLAIDDLLRNGRKDATPVIVLMNDGMSQDPWELVVQTSKRLADSGALCFGVALGSEVDLRELELYTGGSDRIFRDGSTEQFLQSVIGLLDKTQCGAKQDTNTVVQSLTDIAVEQTNKVLHDAKCRDDVDIVVFIDSSNKPSEASTQFATNRYLLLDIIGSISMGTNVRVAIISFAKRPIIVNGLKDDHSKQTLFKIVDSLQPGEGDPNYAAALEKGLEYLKANRRPDVPGLFLIIGDGNTTDEVGELAKTQIKETIDLSVIAVSNEHNVNTSTLEHFTSRDKIYTFRRNSEFSKEFRRLTKSCADENVDIEGSGAGVDEDLAFQKDVALLKEDPFGDSKSVLPVRPAKPLEDLVEEAEAVSAKNTTPSFDQGECVYDVLMLIDSSGSVVETFEREKKLALDILVHLPISPMNVRVSIIKFSSPSKVRTLHGFNSIQTKGHVLKKLESIRMSSGTTAIHSALQHAVNEYSSLNGARPTKATPLVIVFTDGFGNKDFLKEATALRSQVPDLFAVAINHEFPISRRGLVAITGSSNKVFTEKNIDKFHSLLRLKLKQCWV